MKYSPLDRGRRWLGVVLRGFHLCAVIGLGASLLGAPVGTQAMAHAVLASGVTLFALDIWAKPHHLLEMSGISVMLKLGLVGWMAFDPGLRMPLFWCVVVGSAVFAHAPAAFRHARVFGAKKLEAK